MPRVLITGVRGKTGAPLARQLVAAGVDVRGGSTDPAALRETGVTPVSFSWSDRATWTAAGDVDAIFLVRPDVDAAPDLVADLLAATPATTRVTLLSERNADLFPDGHWARRVEAAVRAANRTWAILRPSWFMQVFTDARFYRDDLAAGRLRFPSAGAAVSWIDADDIAAVAAVTLLDAAYDGTVHELSGPESLTLSATAGILGAGLGHRVGYEDVSVDGAVAGLSGFERRQSAETFVRLQQGEFAEVTDSVPTVTGRPATSLRDFVARDV